MGTSSIRVSAKSAVKPGGDADNSCILTLDKGAPLSHVGMLFGGAPNIKLSGCSTRSNTSLNCNGHGSGAAYSIAAGQANNCSNTKSDARVLPDIYECLATEISAQCGSSTPGASWTATASGSSSGPSGVQTVVKSFHTELHVCGNLTVSGTGFLTPKNPSTDYLIIIENGSLTLSSTADISVVRTAIIFTGNNTKAQRDKLPEWHRPHRDTGDFSAHKLGQSLEGNCDLSESCVDLQSRE